jgi:hypothetical protein
MSNTPENQSSAISESSSNLPSTESEASVQVVSTFPLASEIKTFPFWRAALLGVIIIFLVGTFVLLAKGQTNTTICLWNCSSGGTGLADGTTVTGATSSGIGRAEAAIVIPAHELISVVAAGATVAVLTSVAGISIVPAAIAAGLVWLVCHTVL